MKRTYLKDIMSNYEVMEYEPHKFILRQLVAREYTIYLSAKQSKELYEFFKTIFEPKDEAI